MQIGLPGLLGLLFIALKLTGVIAWSWLWVLCPFWIGLAGGIVVFAIWFAIALIVGAKHGASHSRARFRRS